MHYHLRNIKIYCELTTNGVIMKDYVKLTIVIVGVAAVSFLLSGCASIDCAKFLNSPDKEIGAALYKRCTNEKSYFLNKGLNTYDKAKKDMLKGIEGK